MILTTALTTVRFHFLHDLAESPGIT